MALRALAAFAVSSETARVAGCGTRCTLNASVNLQPFTLIQFDMCVFGGRILKRAGVATNCEHLQTFSQVCDSNQKHLPFGAMTDVLILP